MGNNFNPRLRPDQVWTPSEYLVAHGQQITFAISESVTEADRALEIGERIRFAMPSAFTVEGIAYAGIVSVTTHRLLCCSSVNRNLVLVSIPFSRSVGIGHETGLLMKQLPISCDSVYVIVKASGNNIATLRNSLLNAIEAAPNQNPIGFAEASIYRFSAEAQIRVEAIKAAHTGERRLSKAEAAAYAPCPQCKGTAIVERDGNIYCLKCGHSFTPEK